MRATALCLALALAAATTLARAHGDVHQRIEALDRELAGGPRDPARLAERGSLFATDQDWPSAVRDFEEAREIEPALAGLDERLANALLQAGEVERAASLLDELVGREPMNSEARLLRARARARLGQLEDAEADFAAAIDSAPKPSPRMYLDHAEALLDQGPSRADAALAVLDAGLRRLGPLVVLVDRATEIELARGRAAEALGWTERLPEAARTSPDWRLRRAKILIAAGRNADAAQEVAAGLSAIDALPPSRRETEAIQSLRAELLVTQTTLASPEPGRGVRRWIAAAAALLGVAALLLVWARRRNRRLS